jgi:hypothetical protein
MFLAVFAAASLAVLACFALVFHHCRKDPRVRSIWAGLRIGHRVSIGLQIERDVVGQASVDAEPIRRRPSMKR